MAKEKQGNQNPGLFKYFMSKAFWLNIFISIVGVFLILWITLIIIKQYSRHGNSEQVPNLIGMTTDEAKIKLEALDLEYEIMDSTYLVDIKPNTILNQDPLEKSNVKTGRKIYLTINMANPPMVEVPYIEVGTSSISVQEILSSKSLKVGSITYKPFAYKDVFLEMHLHKEKSELKQGTKIPKGSKVDLVMGNGIGEIEIQIPDFRTLTFEEAKNLIQLKQLSLGSIIIKGTITDTSVAFVYKQNPEYEPGKKINIGSMVDVWISETEINPFDEVEDE